MMFVTVHPDHMARSVIASVDWLVALGNTVNDTMRNFAAATQTVLPKNFLGPLPTGRANRRFGRHGISCTRQVLQCSKRDRSVITHPLFRRGNQDENRD
jgi:hypothetical protein